jgi:ABC-type uncharacterized transport system substrate-binding protein
MDMKKRRTIKKPKAIKTKKRKTRKPKAAKAKTSRKLKPAKERTSSKPKGEKKRTRKKLRILAVAAVETGKTIERHIKASTDVDPTFVRPYINGLIEGLLPLKLGQDYDIWYRHILHSAKSGSFAPGHDAVPNDLIFAMSTQVVQLAVQFTKTQTSPKTPIVFPNVSHPDTYIGNPLPSNVAGVNAQRSQTAGTCFADFLQTVPTLQTGTVAYLRCKKYPPSDDAEGMILSAAQQFPNVTLKAMDVTDQQDLKNQLSNLPACDGLQVLPIDFCFGAAGDIIDTVQGNKNLPTFFPIPDWVQPKQPQKPALGAYGVSQYNCGYLAANIVTQIAWAGVSPSAIGAQLAPPASFDWLVSQSAANTLNIALDPQNLQATGATIVP